jgi:HAD superfamily hydrolase (TIGR01509 family)
MSFDCDTFYTDDIVGRYRASGAGNALFYTLNTDPHPIYSYLCTDADGNVMDVREKVKISDQANTGVYCFQDAATLMHYASTLVNRMGNGGTECYTSMIYPLMLADRVPVHALETDPSRVFNLGTPVQMADYLSQRFAFLFDLDGTLVLSDDSYYEVWLTLLEQRGKTLTRTLFDTDIHGKSDAEVVARFLPDEIDRLSEISDAKDALFLAQVHHLTLVPGVDVLLRSIYQDGHPIVIVTNSNRQVAETILKITGIDRWTAGLVCGPECRHPKPQPDPYLKALVLLSMDPSRALIFEDSKAGLLSAKGVSPRCIVGLETMYDHDTLSQSGAHVTMSSYEGVHYLDLLVLRDDTLELRALVHKALLNNVWNIPVTQVDICTENSREDSLRT